jgi:hypothetical protein
MHVTFRFFFLFSRNYKSCLAEVLPPYFAWCLQVQHRGVTIRGIHVAIFSRGITSLAWLECCPLPWPGADSPPGFAGTKPTSVGLKNMSRRLSKLIQLLFVFVCLCLFVCVFVCLFVCLIVRLLMGWWVGWVGRLVSWWAGCLIGWLVGWLFICLFVCFCFCFFSIFHNSHH